jgi:beta-glucosidase
MADPVGAELLAEAAASGQPDPTRDADLVAVVGTMPMSTLAAFRGMSIDHDTLDKLVERWRDRTGGVVSPRRP